MEMRDLLKALRKYGPLTNNGFRAPPEDADRLLSEAEAEGYVKRSGSTFYHPDESRTWSVLWEITERGEQELAEWEAHSG